VSNESTEVIEQQMAATRQSMSDKVAALEEQVVGTLRSTTAAVNETVHSIRHAVEDTVDSVKGTVGSVTESVKETVGSMTDNVQSAVHTVTDNVKDATDITRHVRENPWLVVGGAAAVGLFAGLMFFRRSGHHSAPAPVFVPFRHSEPVSAPAVSSSPRRPGMFDDLLQMLSQEVRKVAETAINTLSESVKHSVHDGIPKMVDGAVTKLTDTLEGAVSGDHGAPANRIKETDWERG